MVFHGNVLSLAQWMSVAMVFGAIMYDAVATAGSKRRPRRPSDVDGAAARGVRSSSAVTEV